MSSLSWYWHRLLAMDVAEVIGRVRETRLKQSERQDRARVKNITLQEPPQNVPSLPKAHRAPEAFKQALAADAANLIAGRWALYGWKDVQVSLPPSWHRDYLHEVDVPVGSDVNHRSLPGGADARTIWEINRWTEMVRLAMHNYVNDDPLAIDTAQGWLEDWLENNPLGEGINWTSALEPGLRLINFCWFDALVRDSQSAGPAPAVLQRQDALAQRVVPAHAWWVRRYLSFGSSANNHRLGELTGLLLAVKRWPVLESVAGKADHLWEKIRHDILAQFAEDGGNREQALHYHLFAMELALHGLRAMEVTGGPLVDRLEKAGEFFARMTPLAESWDYGDSDDGHIVPLTRRRRHSASEWQHALAGAERDGALAFWRAGSPSGEMLMSIQKKIHTRGWWIAPQSGMAVCDLHDWKIRLDASPLGFGKLAAHGHCDALHVSVWDGPHALLVDPGTGSYSGTESRRTELASWEAHNGPQPVAGFTTPSRMGTFLWAQHHAKPVLTQESTDVVCASLKLEGQHMVRRVKMPSGDVISVEDSEQGGGALRVRWHLAPGCTIASAGSAGFLIARSGRQWRMDFSGLDVTASLVESIASPHYGAWVVCPVLEVTATGSLSSKLSRVGDVPQP